MDINDSQDRIIKISIEDEMKSAYIDYSMSVIVSRALPDVRDGLKPVHRRVLFGMNELGVGSGQSYKKSARIVGEVLGKYHPHGDLSVYDTMVRMAQKWSLRYMLVDGQGNFGSIDGDSAAAMRYTEARMRSIAEEVLADLDKDTVDFQKNFDDTLEEPVVLPAKVPLLILNGSSGIAVGMATNMAPHNLSETCDAISAYIDNPEITVDELMMHIKGPDFPTGGIIQGRQGIRDAMETGRGRIVVRSKTDVEVHDSGREVIVVSEIPYMVNKKDLIQKIAKLVESKEIDGISYINDESDMDGMRIVIALKMGAVANVVLNTLFKYTQLQSTFAVNNIALVDGRPRLLNMKQLIKYYVKHRHEVIVRRTTFELAKAEKRAHILEGLLKALDVIDEIIATIRASQTVDSAKTSLMEKFGFTEIQANAIVEMRLRQLANMERVKLQSEYDELQKLIAYLRDILGSVDLQMGIIKDELADLKERYGDERRTEIVASADEFNPEDFYPDEDVVITISHMGYIKRTPLADYRTQNRGGVGSRGSNTRDEDFIEHIYVANMHSTMLFFTKSGRCMWLKVYEIPEGTKTSKGRAIQNVLNIDSDDKVKAYINVPTLADADYVNSHYILLCTKRGIVKKTSLEQFSRPRANGVNAITVREGDELLEALLTDGAKDIMMACREGRCVRFFEGKVRPMGRTASGVKGMSLSADDEVVGMIAIEPENGVPVQSEDEYDETADMTGIPGVSAEEDVADAADSDCDSDEDQDGEDTLDLSAGKSEILVVSENGYGKRSSSICYPAKGRGIKGVKTLNITEKTGKLIAIKDVTEDNDLMIINRSGITIRLAVSDVRVAGRATQGVRLINIRDNDSIAAVCKVNKSEEKLPEPEDVR